MAATSMKLSNIVTAYEQYRQDLIAGAKACVEEGGGTWVGVMEDVACFQSPATRSTLAMKLTLITPEAVREHIRKSNAKFRRNA
jgi:hypothetical protein